MKAYAAFSASFNTLECETKAEKSVPASTLKGFLLRNR